MFKKSFILILMMAFVSTSALADGAKKEDKLAKALENYQKTGKSQLCVSLTRIDTSRVIDDSNILFEMKGNKAYLNHLPHKCSRLGYEKSFSYSLSTNQLCNVDLITVFDSSSNISGPTCGLGKFEEYIEKPKADKKAGK